MTTRRDALVALPLLCASASIRAQAPKSGPPRRIGVLAEDADPKTPESQRPLWVAMSKMGWIVGDNLVIESAFADWNLERLAGLAEELVRKRVDLIVSIGPVATLAAARATQTIPIVFSNAFLPVEQGLIDSFARPGRNLTGIAVYTGVEVSSKRLQFLREIAPAAKRLSWLWPPFVLETVAGGRIDMVSVLEAAARGLGFETRFHLVRTPQDIDAVFGDITAWGAQAISVAGGPAAEARQRIAEFALRHRLPSACLLRANVEAGGLLSYGVPQSELTSLSVRVYEYVDRVLRGARPADLPVERPSRYELVINMSTAKALGLTVPQSLLVRADEIIQ